MNIEELVNKIQGVVRNIPNINNGGCGVFAALVAKRLNKMGIPAVVRIGGYISEKKKHDLINGLNSNTDIGISPIRKWHLDYIDMEHLIVEFQHGGKIYHLDSTTFHEQKERTTNFDCPLYHGHLNTLQALHIARRGSWNIRFNRKKHIPELIKRLNEVFS